MTPARRQLIAAYQADCMTSYHLDAVFEEIEELVIADKGAKSGYEHWSSFTSSDLVINLQNPIPPEATITALEILYDRLKDESLYED